MSKQKHHQTKQKKKDKYHVGTIDSFETFKNRKNKVNPGTNPEIGSKVHRSKKQYDRKRNKQTITDHLNDC